MMNDEIRPARLLLIEDDEADIELTREGFRDGPLDHLFAVARDGEEALAMLLGDTTADDAHTDPPDLILLDLNMPRMDGRAFLTHRRADERLRLTPVVILSTSDHDRDVRDAYDLGANAYLTKPESFDGYIDVAKSIAAFWFKAAKLPKANKAG